MVMMINGEERPANYSVDETSTSIYFDARFDERTVIKTILRFDDENTIAFEVV